MARGRTSSAVGKRSRKTRDSTLPAGPLAHRWVRIRRLNKGGSMPAILLWLLGVPIPIIILIALLM